MGNSTSSKNAKNFQIVTTNLKEIQQNVTTMNLIVNENSMDRQTSDQRTKLSKLRSSTQKVLTDTFNILKDFDDDNDKKLTEIKNQLVDEFKAELYSFERSLVKTARLEQESIEAARTRIAEQTVDVNNINETLTSLVEVRSLFLDSWETEASEMHEFALKLQDQLDQM